MNPRSAVCCHATGPQYDWTAHRQIPLPRLRGRSSQMHEGAVVACAMKRRVGTIFNAANEGVGEARSETSLAELVRGVG